MGSLDHEDVVTVEGKPIGLDHLSVVLVQFHHLLVEFGLQIFLLLGVGFFFDGGVQ